MAVEEKEERVRQGAVAPNGFFVEEGVTVGPRAAVREVVSEFDATSRELQLVATAEVRPGDVILQERVLLEWHANDTELLTQKRANATPSESILAQRCAAIKKLSEQMKSASEHAATVLPLLHAACTASPADFAAILRLPYTLRDTNTPKETLVNKTVFCVMAQKGLSNTVHATRIPDHNTLSRICVIAERVGLTTPFGGGIYGFTSHARRMTYIKPKLVSMGARPGSKKKQEKVPTPNADYTIDENGVLTMRAKDVVHFGDRISIPKEKVWEKKESAVTLLQDKDKMRAAVIRKASDVDAPSSVRAYAEGRHPGVPPFNPTPKDSNALSKILPRNVANEVWHESLLGELEDTQNNFVHTTDHVLNQEESTALLATLSREGSAQSVPFHIGFEQNSRVVAGPGYATTVQHIVQRCGKGIPRNYCGKKLVGAARQGLFLRLTPGEELLQFAMDPTEQGNSVSVPFCVSLAESKSVLTLDGSIEKPLKRGSVVVWKPGITHMIPQVHEGEVAVLLAYLVYGEPQPPAGSCEA